MGRGGVGGGEEREQFNVALHSKCGRKNDFVNTVDLR
jgi:hypothetical protein